MLRCTIGRVLRFEACCIILTVLVPRPGARRDAVRLSALVISLSICTSLSKYKPYGPCLVLLALCREQALHAKTAVTTMFTIGNYGRLKGDRVL